MWNMCNIKVFVTNGFRLENVNMKCPTLFQGKLLSKNNSWWTKRHGTIFHWFLMRSEQVWRLIRIWWLLHTFLPPGNCVFNDISTILLSSPNWIFLTTFYSRYIGNYWIDTAHPTFTVTRATVDNIYFYNILKVLIT